MKSRFLCVIGVTLLCLVSMVAMRPSESRLFMTYGKCAKLTGFTEDMIQLLNRGIWEEDDIVKAWVHCVLVKSKFMTEHGKLRLDDVLKDLSKIEAERTYERINNCLPTHTYNVPPEEISWHFAKCLQREDPDNSLF